MKVNKSLVFALFSIAQLCFTTGCGNMGAYNLSKVKTGSYQFDSYSSDSDWAIEAKFSCTGHPFILPNQDSGFSGTDHYTACPSIQNSTYGDILVKGSSTENHSICVIPAKQDTNGNISWFRDSKTTQPIYLCSDINSSKGTIFSFPLAGQASTTQLLNPGYNAVYIVEQNDMDEMLQHLANQNVQAPNYAFGEFR
jgi:hypothetical protein